MVAQAGRLTGSNRLFGSVARASIGTRGLSWCFAVPGMSRLVFAVGGIGVHG